MQLFRSNARRALDFHIWKHSSTFRMIVSPITKPTPTLRSPGTVSRLRTSLRAVANRNCSTSAFFILLKSSIWRKESCSFSSSSLSLSDLHLSQVHFPLSTTWALTFPQLWWKYGTSVNMCYMEFPIWDFCRTRYTQLAQISQHPHHVQDFSPPPITNSTAEVVAHVIIVPKHDITRTFPSEARHLVLVDHEVPVAQVTTLAR